MYKKVNEGMDICLLWTGANLVSSDSKAVVLLQFQSSRSTNLTHTSYQITDSLAAALQDTE